MTRVGVPVLVQREFRSNIVIVFTGKPGALQGTAAFRGAFKRFSPEELTVDDSDAAHPVYFFETSSDRKVTKNGYTLRLTFFGVDGLTHLSLPTLFARGHEFLIVSDLPEEEAQRATALFTEQLPVEKRPQLHLFATSSKAQSASAVLGQIQDDIVSKADRQ